MEATLHALGGLLVKAVPTFLLVVLLHFYLKRVFFRPLARVLEAREQATAGARKLAEESLALAARKTADYESLLREGRAVIYREQEEARRCWRDQQAEAVRQARESAAAMVSQARETLEAELAAAQRSLEGQSEALAGRIAEAILGRRAA